MFTENKHLEEIRNITSYDCAETRILINRRNIKTELEYSLENHAKM